MAVCSLVVRCVTTSEFGLAVKLLRSITLTVVLFFSSIKLVNVVIDHVDIVVVTEVDTDVDSDVEIDVELVDLTVVSVYVT